MTLLSRLLLLAVPSLLVLAGCGNPGDRLNLERRIDRTISAAFATNNTHIKLSTLTPFAWDTAFVFHPYTAPEAIDRKLGFRWSASVKGELEYSDSFELLVFVKNGRVAQYARVPRSLCDWALNGRNGIPPEVAVFLVERRGGGLEPLLRLAPKN
jgi:hypothetical protein